MSEQEVRSGTQPFLPCPRCAGTGRVPTANLALLAEVAWREHRDTDPWPHIRAIKRLREMSGMTLDDAKNAIHALANAERAGEERG